MGFTRINDNLSVHQSLGDSPNIDNAMTSTDLKRLYDAPANTLKEKMNAILSELESKSSASFLGVNNLGEGDSSGDTVQSKLLYLLGQIQGIVLGSIPDGSITEAKLNSTYSNSIAKNTQMAQLYLASKYNTPTNSGENVQTYTSPSLTTTNHTGYMVTVLNPDGYNTVNDIYTLIGGDGTSYVRSRDSSSGAIDVIIEFPTYIKPSILSFTGYRARGEGTGLYGSNDGNTWELIQSYTVKSTDATENSFNIISDKYYKYLKLHHVSGLSNSVSALYNNIVITGTSLSAITTTNILDINLSESNEKLTSYINGQIVKIITPSTYVKGTNLNATLNINSLGAKDLPNDLETSTKYSLIYDGTKFIKEV